jgi:hypothetical protein
MERHTIPARWLTLRPFTAADIGWVYEVSQDPAVQHFVQVPSPYQMQHAAFFVRQVALAGWDSGQRAEFLAEDAATGDRLGRVRAGPAPARRRRDRLLDRPPRPQPRRRDHRGASRLPLGVHHLGHRTHRVAVRSRQHRFPPGRRESRIPHRGNPPQTAHPPWHTGRCLGRLHTQHRAHQRIPPAPQVSTTRHPPG